MRDDSQDTSELVELLTEGEVWIPVDQEGQIVAIEGPGMLPYLPVFHAREAAAEFFPDHAVETRGGVGLLEQAVEHGWGVVHGVRVGISWGAALGVLMYMHGEEARQFPRVADIAGLGITVGLPSADRLPDGFTAALRHVLAADLSIERAWLLALTPAGLPEQVSALVVLAEAIEGMDVDPADLTQRLAWSSPPGSVVEAFALGDDTSPLASSGVEERVVMWPPIYPETAVH